MKIGDKIECITGGCSQRYQDVKERNAEKHETGVILEILDNSLYLKIRADSDGKIIYKTNQKDCVKLIKSVENYSTY